MDSLTQIRGVLRGIRSITQTGLYTDVYSGMEEILATTYEKCLDALVRLPGFENLRDIVPDLSAPFTMQKIAFGVEICLSLIREASGMPPGFPPGPMHFGPWSQVATKGSEETSNGPGGLKSEQDGWENQIHLLERKLQRIQDEIESTQEQMQKRLESIHKAHDET